MKFENKRFQYDGMYLTYDGKFVARFKRGGKTDFVKFLVKNFTVEEYFAALQKLPPVSVLETKGYVTAQVKKLLKIAGFEQSQAGLQAYLIKSVA